MCFGNHRGGEFKACVMVEKSAITLNVLRKIIERFISQTAVLVPVREFHCLPIGQVLGDLDILNFNVRHDKCRCMFGAFQRNLSYERRNGTHVKLRDYLEKQYFYSWELNKRFLLNQKLNV